LIRPAGLFTVLKDMPFKDFSQMMKVVKIVLAMKVLLMWGIK
jgi:hypothetical protein